LRPYPGEKGKRFVAWRRGAGALPPSDASGHAPFKAFNVAYFLFIPKKFHFRNVNQPPIEVKLPATGRTQTLCRRNPPILASAHEMATESRNPKLILKSKCGRGPDIRHHIPDASERDAAV
jgi:hypothetical protein